MIAIAKGEPPGIFIVPPGVSTPSLKFRYRIKIALRHQTDKTRIQ